MLVMKFGGAAVATPAAFTHLARLIRTRQRACKQIAVVVSAMGNMTDQLLDLAGEVHPHPPKRELDMLLSAGERISMSLLAMALARAGVGAVSFTGSQAGIVTSCAHADAQIVEVRPQRLQPHLERGRVVIVGGFQGVSEAKEVTTLGRGGSDTTAVALAVALNASHVEFYKEVKGIFDRDPRHCADARLLPTLTYDQALALANGVERPVLHPRALLLAQQHALPLHVRSFQKPNDEGSWVGASNSFASRPSVV